jgi:hypothetical protein
VLDGGSVQTLRGVLAKIEVKRRAGYTNVAWTAIMNIAIVGLNEVNDRET